MRRPPDADGDVKVLSQYRGSIHTIDFDVNSNRCFIETPNEDGCYPTDFNYGYIEREPFGYDLEVPTRAQLSIRAVGSVFTVISHSFTLMYPRKRDRFIVYQVFKTPKVTSENNNFQCVMQLDESNTVVLKQECQ